MQDKKQIALDKHREWKGKLEIICKCPVENAEDLSVAYTPGVAEPCLEIAKDVSLSYEYTGRANTVAVISDGTAVLGLGDIGAEASMPVMEGKCVLFKAFAGVNAIPLCIKSKDVDEIVRTIKLLEGSFGGVNLEDIAAPRCFEIEKALKEQCEIPIFHDDQHGTAIIVLAAVMNALKLVGKNLTDIKMVINGDGAAATAITKLLLSAGAKNITVVNLYGALHSERDDLDSARYELACMTNPNMLKGSLGDVIDDADVFIGVSAAGCLKPEMVAKMAEKSIVFAMANPSPEIFPEEALAAGAYVVGTGRSDYPNQINNVLAFPGVFRGALDVLASDINDEMKVAAAHALASLVSDEDLKTDYVIPYAFDNRVGPAIAEAVKAAAIATGVNRK
ncbi:MAG: malic enzyme-like NAD(P)-binding protein [Clostridia bacterium]